MSDQKVHALIIPWPISEGLRTWCGRNWRGGDLHDRDLETSVIATDPIGVTCPECARAMRIAATQLIQWVPRLTV